jgi:hydrogenase maturation protein HypF
MAEGNRQTVQAGEMTEERVGRYIKVKGIIQGVGFRPFIFNLAENYALTGWVRNSSSGLEITVNGTRTAIETFVDHIRLDAPPLARIDSVQTTESPLETYTSFTILPSLEETGNFVPISPDMTICPDCQRELFDEKDRRYRYPFINCTNCGPRFTIIKDIPYDRPKTTMAGFKLCPDCLKEYEDPRDRRFHAQPVACPDCGPQVWFTSGGEKLSEKEAAIQQTRAWLRAGKIVAIKGLGGFHLACDAANAAAVDALRARKKRSDKPFALMAFSVDLIKKYCTVSAEEEALLLSPQHPIVLLKTIECAEIAPGVAPEQNTLGFMLPYTPLHLLLLEPAEGYPQALVMTSGNLSEEPVAFIDDEAMTRLSSIADGFLMNDRPIHMRVDDSVVRIFESALYPIRRSRGYAPQSLPLPTPGAQVLACGAELKNTFCLSREDQAFVSHHIGDLENYETLTSFETGVEHFKNLFRVTPEVIAADLHPDYLSTRYAVSQSTALGLPLVRVQHHHAHLAACLADNGWNSSESVIGLAFDGTGLGLDNAIWGGEVLIGNYAGFTRRFHLEEMPLPGGDAAIRNPARIALAYLIACGLEWPEELTSASTLCYEERTILRSQIDRKINTPLTTSMGRLFDAVSALIGVRQTATYEGQAAIELENLCSAEESSAYSIPCEGEVIKIKPLLEQVLSDWSNNVPNPVISARFHNGLAQLALELCVKIRQESSLNTVALSGGVWQNITLLGKTVALLRKGGFHPLIHRQVPANDGGISLGQVLIAQSMITQ